MDFRERTDAIANLLRYLEEQLNHKKGLKISVIKDIFSNACDVLVVDSDIKYLFEKKRIEYCYDAPDMDKAVYIKGLDLRIKITQKGVDFLNEEKHTKTIPLDMVQLVKDGIRDVK